MVKVILKNTFLSVEEQGGEEEPGGLLGSPPRPLSKAASPRSRSLECSSSPRERHAVEDFRTKAHDKQLGNLNQLVEKLSNSRLGSPKSGASPGSASPNPNNPVKDAGPSVEDMEQLQRRLEEVFMPRSRESTEDYTGTAGFFPRVASSGSVSSMGGPDAHEDAEMFNRGRIRTNLSSNSIASLGSDQGLGRARGMSASFCTQEAEEEENVEFDLMIEEDPKDDTTRRQPTAPTAPAPTPIAPSMPEKISLQQTLGLGYPSAPDPPHGRKSRGKQQHNQGFNKAPQQPNSAFSPSMCSGSRDTSPGSPKSENGGFRGQRGPQANVQGYSESSVVGASSPASSTQRASPHHKSGSASPSQPQDRFSPSSCSGSRASSAGAPGSEQNGIPAKGGSPSNSIQRSSLGAQYRHGHVPKNVDLEKEFSSKGDAAPATTLMIRNLPNRYTQRELIDELDDLGFAGTFDFLYIPVDKGTMSNVGYAFVNFVDYRHADRCMEVFQNYRFKKHRNASGKIAAISVAHIQGLEANLKHYENSAVNSAKLKQRRPVVMANISSSLLSCLE